MGAAIVVVGTGYTGARILKRISRNRAIGISRSVPELIDGRTVERLDLDRIPEASPGLPFELPPNYTVIYTVPPAIHGDTDADPRLRRFVRLLAPRPQRFVYISTTGVYGNHDGALIAEGAELRPGSERASRRLAAETLLQQFCHSREIELVILRVPGIYGPGRLGIKSIRDASPVLLEADSYPGNRIHVTDLVSCCINATSSSVPPGIYNVGDGDARSSTWFAHEVARQCGLPPRPEITRTQAEREFSAQRMSFLADSRRIDTRKMLEVLGVTLRHGQAEDGIQASLNQTEDGTCDRA